LRRVPAPAPIEYEKRNPAADGVYVSEEANENEYEEDTYSTEAQARGLSGQSAEEEGKAGKFI
jgi:hypothetical protein